MFYASANLCLKLFSLCKFVATHYAICHTHYCANIQSLYHDNLMPYPKGVSKRVGKGRGREGLLM